MVMLAEELTGRTLGDFVVRHKIGEGGFGAVYRAEQPALGREAVIKVLHGKFRGSRPVIQRFLREARLASKLDHPYAAHIYAFGVETDGLMWIAMEYVRGQSLYDLLKAKGPLRVEELVPLLDRICEVLQAAHDLGIVHRDIKPPNVMVVQRAGRTFPKLLDFGIAKLRAVDAEITPAGPIDRPIERPTPPPVSNATAVMRKPIVASVDPAMDATATADPPSDATASFVGLLGGGVAPIAAEATPSVHQDLALTEAGATMGSPPYMAPEQWDDSSTASARTDLYALGILAYEALVGRRPFTGATTHALAIEHATAQVPALPATLPRPLDDVFGKVLAKEPAHRYETALEFAQAFRAAAGLGEAPLPAFDDDLRVSVETSFPQPIADAVAAYQAARNAHQARDSLRDVVTTTIRYVATIAIAMYAQTKPDDRTAADALVAALRELHRRPLTDAEWVALARAAVQPFGALRALPPMRELVDVLLATDEDNPLSTVTRTPASGDALATVRALLPEVTRLLRRLAFVADYPLVVVAGERAESWMGLRRPRRVALELHGPALEAGQPSLADATGRAVLSLWPLVQVSPPLPEAAPELFFCDGRGRRGARLVALPQPLERQDEALWSWLVERFAEREVEGPVLSGSGEPAPFRGLAAFTAADAKAFVGREREIDAALNRLRIARLLAVVGPSGAGKSSFVHAGLVPALQESAATLVVRPGPTPLATLETRLLRAQVGDRSLVLIVDQFEELFTLGAPPEERRAFVGVLVRQLRDERVRVILTLRDDFLARATQIPELRDPLPSALFLLGTPDRAALLRIVLEPATRADYRYEDPALPERIVSEVADTPGALPLISFTCQKLWELRDRQFRQLTRRAYESLGGVAGALAHHAEATLDTMTANEQRLARIALCHLVTAEGTRAILSRSELDQLLDDPNAASVIEKLITARLLTATESDAGDDAIEIVHEALVVAWPRLAEWRRENVEGARLRDQLRAAARQWHERDRPRGLLWRDDALAELKAWRTRNTAKLTDTDDAFVRASLAEAARGQRIRRGVIGTVLALMATALVVLGWARSQAQQRARQERQSAQRERDRRRDELLASARQNVLDGHAREARDALAQARAVGGEADPTYGFLLAAATRSDRAHLATFRGHTKAVVGVAFDAAGRRVLTASEDGTAKLWNVATGQAEVTFDGCHHQLWNAVFDRADEHVATECAGDGAVRIYSVDGRLQRTIETGTADAFPLAMFSPDGKQLITAAGSTIATWRIDTGAAVWTNQLTDSQGPDQATSVDVTSDGARIVTSGVIGRLWDAHSGALLASLPTGPSAWAEFSPDDTVIATASWDGHIAQLWDAHDGHLIRTLTGHSAFVDRARFSPDGKVVATSSRDHTVRVWDTATGTLLFSLGTGRAIPRDLAFSASGNLLAAALLDGTALVWDRTSGTPLAILDGHRGGVRAIAFDETSARIVTGSDDATAMLWQPTAAGMIHAVLFHGSPLQTAQFAGSRAFVTSANDGVLRLWDVETGALRAQTKLPGTSPVAAVTSDGSRVVAGDLDGNVSIWDGSSARVVARHKDSVDAIAISPDDALFASAGHDAVVRVMRLDGTLVTELASRSPVTAVAFSRDHERIAAADGNLIRVWTKAGKPLFDLAGHSGQIDQLAFTQDGRILSASADSTARVWSRDGQPLFVLRHGGWVHRVTLDSTEARAVTASNDGTARVWDLSTGAELQRFEQSSLVFDALFLHDKLVISGGDDALLHVWSVENGRELLRADGHGMMITVLAESPDGHFLATAGQDGKVILWQLPED